MSHPNHSPIMQSNISRWIYKLVLVILMMAMPFQRLAAQHESSSLSVEDMAKERQNPVSGLRSLYIQDIVLPVNEGTANLLSLQPVWPFKISSKIRLVTYTIIPFQWIPQLDENGEAESGMGNILFNGYFSPTKRMGNITWGIGPAIQIPTRTNPALGTNRVSLGPTALLFYNYANLSLGTVVQNYWSLGGTGANKVNLFSLQYIAFYNFKKGWFLQSNSTIQANWLATTGDTWYVPVGGGPGKTFQLRKNGLFYCATAQLFYNVVKPGYVGNWQSTFQFQIIF